MASTVYYGKSTTASGETTKQVVLENVESLPSLQSGDLLGVYFAQGNTVTPGANGIRLALYIGDVDSEGNTNDANGSTIFNTADVAVGSGDWKDGEVVLFSYTLNSNVTENPNAVAYWEMVAKAHAKSDVYGDVLLEDQDSTKDESAATIGLIKQMIEDALPPEWQYHDLTSSPHQQIGTFYVIDDEDHQIEKAQIYIPKNVGFFDNDVGYISKEVPTDLIFTGEDSNGSKELQIQNPEDESPTTVIDLDNYEGLVGIYGDTYVYGDLHANNLDTGKILTDEIHVHTEGQTIQVTSPINIGNTIHLNNDVYIGDQTLEDYIKDLFDDEDSGIQSMIDEGLAGALADYMFTKRYYASVPNTISQNSIVMVVFGDNPTETRSDVAATYYSNESLHVPGYDIAAVTTWETWQSGDKSNPKNANVFGIWWQANDPQQEVLYLKVTAVDAPVETCDVSVDILYKKSAYTIDYNAMGGVDAPSPQHKLYNQTIRLSGNEPTKPGAYFKGWRTNPNSLKIAYQPNQLYSENASHTLYALWSDNGGQLVYNTQGLGILWKTTYNMLYEEAVYALQGPRAISERKHIFNEWNTDPYGYGDSYSPRSLIKAENEPPFDLTLYAIWDKKILTYMWEDDSKEVYMTYPYETRLSSDIFTREGYIIDHWNTKADDRGISYNVNYLIKEANAVPEQGALTLYAIWRQQNYITFNGNYESSGVVTNGLTFKDAALADCGEFHQDNLVVNYWTTESDGSGTIYPVGATVKPANTMPTENIILYAQWVEPQYVTYQSYTPYDIKDGDKPQDLGLYEFDETQDPKYFPTTDTTVQSKIYYCKEEPIEVEQTYADAVVTPRYIKTYNHRPPHWKLASWNTAADGSGDSYGLEAELKAKNTTPSESFELYAQWALDHYDPGLGHRI
jgi:hypothetical protein